MLVLTIRTGEFVQIGESIQITMLEKRAGQVRIGFDAPSDVTILRESLVRQQQIEQRNEPAL